MRRFFAVPFVLLALGAAPAQAVIASRAVDTPASLTESVTTAHFVVHYTSAAGDPNAFTAVGAQMLAANAEAAYAVEVGQWGYPPPADDGDGKTDVYVFTFPSAYAGYAGLAWVSSSRFPYPASIGMNRYAATEKSVVAHEFFHVLQFGVYPVGKWVEEATARWAEHQLAAGFWSDFFYLQHPDMPLDCEYADCPAGTWDGGYNRWLFFGYLSDLYGRDVVRQIFQTARSQYDATHTAGTQTETIDAVLKQHGSTLTRTFDDFATANAAKTYASAHGSPAVPTFPLTIGADAAGTSVTVEHLAAKYVEFDGSSASVCAASSLHVRVTLPLGLDSVALVVGSVVTRLDVSNGAATGVVPWTNCSKVLLVLPNGSTSGGAVTFGVQASVGTDLPPAQPPVQPPTPPPPSTTGADPAPTLSLVGLPAVLTVSSKKPVLTLFVTSNGPGRLAVSWDGGGTLGTFDLRPGVNSIRLTFPRGLKGRRTLVLTSLSAAGAQGQSIRQQVLFTR